MSLRPPAAFLSYAHNDDVEGITALRAALERAVRHYTGDPTFSIFWDRDHIAWGEQWRYRVDAGLDATTVLLPILTPSFFLSAECRRELRMFVDRDRDRGRVGRVLPIYYIDAHEMNARSAASGRPDDVARVLRDVQYADWRDLRFEPPDSPPVRRAVARLAERIRDIHGRGSTDHRPSASTAGHLHLPGGSMRSVPLRVVFAVDTSSTMAGARSGQLDHAIRESLPAFKSAADENPHVSVEMAVLTFGSHARWVTPPAVPLEQFGWSNFSIDSSVRPDVNGALYALAASMRTMPTIAAPPLLVLILANSPAADVTPGLSTLLRTPWGRKSVRVAIAMGDDAPLDVLRRFIDHPEIEPLVAHNSGDLATYMKFVDEQVDDETDEIW